jgi:hypothetical protein
MGDCFDTPTSGQRLRHRGNQRKLQLGLWVLPLSWVPDNKGTLTSLSLLENRVLSSGPTTSAGIKHRH